MSIVTDDWPGTKYDVITWDGAVEHFSNDQVHAVPKKCVGVLKPQGVLYGYTIVARSSDKSHSTHQHEFGSPSELKEILTGFFPWVGTIETEYLESHNKYFCAAFTSARLRRFD